MRSIEKMITDDTLQSKMQYGDQMFQLAAYCDEKDCFHSKSISWHWHREFQFSLLESGRVDFYFDSEKIVLYPGDVIFINSNVIHSYDVVSGMLKSLMFTGEFIAPVASAIYHKCITPIELSSLKYFVFRSDSKEADDYRDMLEHIFREEQTHYKMWEQHVFGAVVDLWGKVIPALECYLETFKERNVPDRTKHERMQKMLAYIHCEYMQPISIDDIAGAANISRSEALRCFHRYTNDTPQHYLAEYRLKRAEALLLSSTDSIENIAWKTGFGSAGYFCRIFKEAKGMTPRVFRKHTQSIMLSS